MSARERCEEFLRLAIRDHGRYMREDEALEMLAERLAAAVAEEALQRIADENYLRVPHGDGWQGMCAHHGCVAREALAMLKLAAAPEAAAGDAT